MSIDRRIKKLESQEAKIQGMKVWWPEGDGLYYPQENGLTRTELSEWLKEHAAEWINLVVVRG